MVQQPQNNNQRHRPCSSLPSTSTTTSTASRPFSLQSSILFPIISIFEISNDQHAHYLVSKIGHSHYHQPVIHKLELKTLKSLKSHGGVDRALLSFDIHADMEPAFHWNVKQLFVYVVASYETDSKKVNQVVIWDKIVEAIDPVKEIKQENVFVKYALVDQGDELRGKDVQLQLMWDHMPITGFLYMGEQPKDTMTQFTLPSEYQ
ncbi:signal peptidase subunit [Nitzschia inconspicua]|uniref:Signal peptidase complex subunit 3 n=1 Tax=Nitzschia inconspicua TaxID=303405 RepID=A0A9K3LM79_9STRA|nr:signal peptidase subunit [Nitzschia inconspicua]